MSSFFILWIDKDPCIDYKDGVHIDDPIEATSRFFEALRTAETATLKWSS